MRTFLRIFAVAALIAASPLACSHRARPAPLAPQFTLTAPTPTHKEMTSDPLSGVDQPGALYENVRVDQYSSQSSSPQRVQRLSRTVQENVTAPGTRGEEPLAEAATRPATTRLVTTRLATTGTTTMGVSSGQYLTLGGVVAEVNGTPIYAHKVLSLVEPVLAARAKELDEATFRAVATREITQQMVALRNLELEYAAAERNLDQKDKDLADGLTMQWKQRQITSAGGSIELAKRRAAEHGEDFDELLHQQYRVVMSRIYYEKRVIPRIQVNAADMRAYYDRDRDREFTDIGSARFRLIKIDVRKTGTRDEAMRKIAEIRNRIVKAGEPFDAVARSVNDDPRLLKNGGDLGAAIQQGAFAIEKVEQAVWATAVGEVTPVVDAGDALYIAKVEEKKAGHVLPFEDETVQTKISDTLRAEQFRALREQEQEKLVKQAVLRSDVQMLNIAIEMAMQNYSRWAGK